MNTYNQAKDYYQLKLSSKRNCKLFVNFLNSRRIGHSIENSNHANPEQIKNFLNNYNLLIPSKEALIEQAQQYIYLNLIPLHEFNWLKDSQRACNWAWTTLKTANDEVILSRTQPHDNNNIPVISKTPFMLYDIIVNGPPPSSTPSRFKSIIDFFDGWVATPPIKYNLLGNLKLNWGFILKTQINLKWLDRENIEQCDWTWNYINKNIPPYGYLQPLSHKETYHFIYAYLDFWEAHPDTKKVFITKLKKAWDQKTYRKKQSNKFPLNTYLEEDTKIMLDSLAEQRGQKIHETLEWMIKKEFNNYS